MTEIRRMAFGSALIIANPTAGRVDADLVAELILLCQSYLPSVSVHWTDRRGDAAQMAADAVHHRFDVVIAVGGDGTVREVAEGLLASGAEVGSYALLVVPGGTGNSNYLAQWGELPWQEAVHAALSGLGSSKRLLDLARLVELGDLVLLGACSGVIADALIKARTVPASGRQRYRVALAEAAAEYEYYPGRVTVDGNVVHAASTVLANVGGGRHRGGTYQLLPHSLLDDGLLDVCVIGVPVDPVDVARLTLAGEHVTEPGVVYARGRRIVVERTDGKPLRFEHDGELRTTSGAKFTLEVLPRVLPVLCRAGMPGLSG